MSNSNKAGNIKNSQGIAIGDGARAEVNIHNYAAPAEKPTFPIHQIAHPQNPNFTGREQILQQVAAALTAGQTTVVTQTIAGLGGVGKTQLALAYSYAHRGSYDLIYWLSADSEPGLGEGLMALARRLKLIGLEAADQKAAIEAVQHWLGQTNQRWLLVYDNADMIEPGQLTNYLPRSGNGHVLITSRNPNYGGVGQVLELGLFALDEAVHFLFRRKEAKGEKVERGSKAWQEAAGLAEALGRLPLALEHAAAYVESKGSSYARYHQLFSERQNELWQRAERPERYHATITTTWELAFDQVKQTPGALDLLNLCCFLDPESIPLDLLKGLEEPPKKKDFWNRVQSFFIKSPQQIFFHIATDNLALEEAIGSLRRYSLIERNADLLVIHRLVQDVVRNRMDETVKKNLLEIAIDLLYKTYQFDEYDITTWPICSSLLPHLIFVADLAKKLNYRSPKTLLLNNETGFYLQIFGKYTSAQPYFEYTLDGCVKILGYNHPLTAQSLNSLGALLHAMGNLSAAQPYLEKALEIRDNCLEQNHPDIAMSLNNLGSLLLALGEPQKAKPYLERALSIRQQTLNPGDLYIAQSLSGLGSVLHSLGDMHAAIPYFEGAHLIYEKHLPPNHPELANSLNNLGGLLQALGDMSTAQSCFERALKMRQETLGNDHPVTAQSLLNLGSLLLKKGDLEAAKPYLEWAANIYEEKLGSEHPHTATSLNNLGGLFGSIGDFASARAFYQRAIDIREKILSPNHPDIAQSINNLAVLTYEEGNYLESAQLMQKALTIYERQLGTEHPDTVSSRSNLAAIEAKISS